MYHYYVVFSYFAQVGDIKGLGVGSLFVAMPCLVQSIDDVKQLSEITRRLAGHESIVVTNWKHLAGEDVTR